MDNKQIWIKCKTQKELDELQQYLINNGFKLDLCDDVTSWPIVIDNELKVAFSVDKPSYCAAYINAGGKVKSIKDFFKEV